MCLKYLEDELRKKGIVIDLIQLFVLLYVDNIIFMANTASDLQKALDILENDCIRWKLTVNVIKTKIVIFRRVADYLLT